jgi:hypothetical protein
MLQGGLVFSGIILGLGLIIWYVYSQVTTATDAPVMLTSPQVLSNAKARQTLLDKARDYQIRIQEAVARMRAGLLRDRLLAVTRQIDEWIAYLERLVTRLGEFDRDPVIRRDLSTVPRAIHSLEARLTLEQDTDADLKDAVCQTLDARRTQLRHLHALEQVMAQAELISEQAVTALGTIYSQVLLMDAKKDIQSTQAQSLQTDIAERVKTLQDLLSAMEDIQHSRQDTRVEI